MQYFHATKEGAGGVGYHVLSGLAVDLIVASEGNILHYCTQYHVGSGGVVQAVHHGVLFHHNSYCLRCLWLSLLLSHLPASSARARACHQVKVMLKKWNTSLAAKGALAHRLQRRTYC